MLPSMKRLLVCTAMLFFALAAPANASLSVVGGSPEQRAAVYETIGACAVRAAQPVRVEIVEVIEGAYFRTAGIAMPGVIQVRTAFDNYRPEPQRVSYARGEANSLFRDIIAHEYGHQVWYGLPEEVRQAWNRSHFQLPNWPPPLEAFAENFRLTMYPEELLFRTTTASPYPMLTKEDMERFIMTGEPSQPQYPQRIYGTILTLYTATANHRWIGTANHMQALTMEYQTPTR